MDYILIRPELYIPFNLGISFICPVQSNKENIDKYQATQHLEENHQKWVREEGQKYSIEKVRGKTSC